MIILCNTLKAKRIIEGCLYSGFCSNIDSKMIKINVDAIFRRQNCLGFKFMPISFIIPLLLQVCDLCF